MRLRDVRPRTLWVDAICINQDKNDVKEKEWQVPLMRDIYRSRRRVLVWLGKHDRRTKRVFEALDFLSSQYGTSADPYPAYRWQTLRRGGKDSFFGQVRGAFETVQAEFDFASVFGRRWFQRIWIIQEISVSPSALMICGEHQIDWQKVQDAQRFNTYEIHNSRLTELFGIREIQQNSPRVSFLEALRAGRMADSADQRDKIYACL